MPYGTLAYTYPELIWQTQSLYDDDDDDDLEPMIY